MARVRRLGERLHGMRLWLVAAALFAAAVVLAIVNTILLLLP